MPLSRTDHILRLFVIVLLAPALAACDNYSNDEPEVIVTDLVEGTGTRAEPGMLITVDYLGWFSDGTVFDTSREEDREPYSFILGAGRVIDGWDEGLRGMRVGGKRQLEIPPELAYGRRGLPPTIPPNATLFFEVDLLDVAE